MSNDELRAKSNNRDQWSRHDHDPEIGQQTRLAWIQEVNLCLRLVIYCSQCAARRAPSSTWRSGWRATWRASTWDVSSSSSSSPPRPTAPWMATRRGSPSPGCRARWPSYLLLGCLSFWVTEMQCWFSENSPNSSTFYASEHISAINFPHRCAHYINNGVNCRATVCFPSVVRCYTI